MKTRDLLQRARIVLVAAVAAALACSASTWAVPATIQYQGYLADADGTPVTGELRVVFRLYDDADPALSPTALWEEAHDDVPITAGKFAVALGAISPFAATEVSFDEPLFLELEISLERLLPRLPLHSVPYALKAAGVVAGGVTAPMLAEAAVQAGKVHLSVAGTGLTVSAAGTLQVATGGITAELLADGSIVDRHVSLGAAISPAKIAGTAVTLAAGQTLTNKVLDANLNQLMNVDLTEFRPGAVLTELTAATKEEPGADDHLATAAAIIQFVESTLAAQDSLGELADTALSGVSVGDLLVADGAGHWVNRTLSGDLTIDALGGVTVQPDAVALGAQTTGDYVATLQVGPGLTGGGSGEGSTALVDLVLGDALAVGGEPSAVHVLFDHLTIVLNEGGELQVDGTQVDAGAVNGAHLDDDAAAAANVLWSSLKFKGYVDALVYGLDWQQSIKFVTLIIPPGLFVGLRVISDGAPGWNDNSIYEYDGAVWHETIPNEGFAAWIEDQDRNFVFNGTEWVPLSSTQDHAGLAGLQGGDAPLGQYYHLTQPLYDALTGLPMKRLLETDSAGLPTAAALATWIDSANTSLVVAPRGDGGVTLDLGYDVPRANPIKDNVIMGDGSHWISVPQTDLTQLGIVTVGTWNGTPIDGDYIDLAPDGGITHGSGLKISLDPVGDGSLVINSGYLTVGEIGSEQIRDESLTGGDVQDGSLSGDDLATDTIPIDRLLGIYGNGRPGQTVLADGEGGFVLGSELPMSLSQGTTEWTVARALDAGKGSEPRGVAQDATGKLYVADNANHCVLVFTCAGGYLGWYGAGDDGSTGFHAATDPALPAISSAVGGFNAPNAVAVMEDQSGYYIGGKDSSPYGVGILWVADSGNDRVQAIDLGTLGASAEAYGGADIDLAGLGFPTGIATDGNTVFIADQMNHRVVRAWYSVVSTPRLAMDVWYGGTGTGLGGWHWPVGEEDPWPDFGAGDLEFHSPMHLSARYEPGFGTPVLAVADTGNYRVMLIDLWSGTMLGWIGADSDGGTGWHDPAPAMKGPTPVSYAGDGGFISPWGVALGNFGLAVSDPSSHDVEFYQAPTLLGKGPSYTFASSFLDDDWLYSPAGMVTDADGSLWVCDMTYSKVLKLVPPHEDYSVVPPASGNVIIGGDIPVSSAALQINSCGGGVLLPRYELPTLLDGGAIQDPVEGLLVYSYGYQGGEYKEAGYIGQGFYFWDGESWQLIGRPALDPDSGLYYNYNDELAVNWYANPFLYKADEAPKSDSSGGPIAVRDSAGLQAALTTACNATAEAPMLIRLAPGVYTAPLALCSHVDIEGSGIGKTIIRVQGGTAVTATGVVNAGLRQLTIEVVGQGGTADLVGVQYDGAAEGTALRLVYVDVRVRGAVTGRGIGIRCGQTGQPAATGLRLEHTCIDVHAAATGGVAALEVNGAAEVLGCELRAGSDSGAAVGVLIDPRDLATASFRQVTASIRAGAADSAAWRVRGSGAIQLKGCVLSAAGSAADTVLDVAGEAADRQARVRLDETSLRLDTTAAGPTTSKARVGSYGRLDAFSVQMLGHGAAVTVDKAGRLAAFYCLLEGHSAANAATRYSFCTTVDSETGDAAPMAQPRARPR